jgi:hypothetical protein
LVNKRWFMEGSSSSENIHQTTVKWVGEESSCVYMKVKFDCPFNSSVIAYYFVLSQVRIEGQVIKSQVWIEGQAIQSQVRNWQSSYVEIVSLSNQVRIFTKLGP